MIKREIIAINGDLRGGLPSVAVVKKALEPVR
jgi:hypothetical protein